MIDDDTLSRLDATAQAELVRNREISAAELVEATVERIERFNPAINAVVTPMYDEARAVAADVGADGRFAGVPFLLKDLGAPYAGVPMTSGTGILERFVPEFDSELVSRIKRAGLIVIGKTNTPELGCHATTEPRLFGPSRNPWDTERTTGGSSGGSAAAVAARLVPMAHGNDGGGSIRIPASCCGVFGLKPTRARNPMGPESGHPSSMLAADHALTISVRDSASLLDCTCGPDPGAPYVAPPPQRPFIDEVGADPGQLHIAYSSAMLSGAEAHIDCRAAVEDAVGLCAELGHVVEEGSPDVDGAEMMSRFSIAFAAMVASRIQELELLTRLQITEQHLEPLTWAVYERGLDTPAAQYLLALSYLQLVSRTMATFFERYDVWLTPTLGEPPVTLGTFDLTVEQLREFGEQRILDFMPFTPICNVTGLPAMSVPLFWNASRLPVGTQFVAPFGAEARLFRLAAQLEEARPWAGRRPPVCA